eukprot:scaffold12093_cov137-Isochrysis_galbana.AAC.10
MGTKGEGRGREVGGTVVGCSTWPSADSAYGLAFSSRSRSRATTEPTIHRDDATIMCILFRARARATQLPPSFSRETPILGAELIY